MEGAMIESKGWNWKIVSDDKDSVWKNPAIESYYLLNRWISEEKKDFLDLYRSFDHSSHHSWYALNLFGSMRYITALT